MSPTEQELREASTAALVQNLNRELRALRAEILAPLQGPLLRLATRLERLSRRG